MDSRTYWRRREELFQRQDIKSDKELAKKMNDVLTETSDEIQKEIDAFYSRYATREGISLAEVNKRVAKMEVDRFAKQAKEYVKNKDFSDKANHELKIYNLKMKTSRLELLKAKVDLHLIGATSDMEGILREGAYEQALMEYERDAGILADSVQFDVEKRVQQVLDGSYSLKDSPTFKTFSDNIWLYKTELQNDLEKMLVRSFTRGENPRVMARELKKRFDVTGYQAERLARTETARLQTAIQKDSIENNGIEQYEFIAEPTACHLCRPLDSKISKVDDLVIGDNASPMHPNCRCRIAPYVSSKTMYDDWLKAGIINKEEYQSALSFKKDYDTEFEKLMEKRNEYEKSMAKKRRDRLPTDHIDKKKRRKV